MRPDREGPPAAGPARPFRFPPYVRHPLPGGGTLLAARLGKAPLAVLRLLYPAGSGRDTPAMAGRALLTGLLLDEGTRRSSALELAVAAERLGATLSSGADWDFGHVGLHLLASHAAAGLALIAEVATEATFPPDEVERLRRQRLAEIMRRRADPAYLARERFDRAVYGEASAYGLPASGTEETLSALHRDDLVDFYRRHYTPAGAVAVIVGDLDPEALAASVDGLLGEGGPPPPPPPVEPREREGIEIHLVDRPAAAQTQLLVGHAGVRRAHPDWIPLAVLNALLGGKFTSRINLNLRERNGYTYGANSRFEGRIGPGPFTVGTAVANAVAGAAAGEILGELERIRQEPVSAEELEDSCNYLIGVFPYTLQTVAGLAFRLEALAVYGLPEDHYDRFAEAVAAVDRETVLAAARRHLHPERAVVVAVGPAAELAPQFERLGPVRVVAAPAEAAPTALSEPGGGAPLPP